MNVAVITGASMGLGEEFARQLAARRQHLVLVARSEEKLQLLADELQKRHGVRALPCVCDLSKPGAALQVAEFLSSRDLHPRWLINNAGFGAVGALDSIPFEQIRDMMMVNVNALVELTHLLLPQLRLGRESRIINVASTAAFQPVAFFNVYSATKVFVLHFSEALREELRGSDVKVLALCPGPTPTNFHVTAKLDESVFQKGQSAADVVRMGLRASDAGHTVLVCQRAWLLPFMRLFPRSVVRMVAALVAKQMMKKL